jgi:catechol 2,3-dioxygenase-like lactoylglutathione lyase family enzyme
MTEIGLLHHVEIYVNDLDAAKDFWGWLLSRLGYGLFQEWDMGISYKKADTYIVFVQTEEKHRMHEYHRCHSGINHLAFHATREFIDTITEELRARGVTILYPNLHPYAAGKGCYAVFFEDPMRMKVELSAYR